MTAGDGSGDFNKSSKNRFLIQNILLILKIRQKATVHPTRNITACLFVMSSAFMTSGFIHLNALQSRLSAYIDATTITNLVCISRSLTERAGVNAEKSIIMFRMDPIIRNLVESEYHRYAPDCPLLVRLEMECLVLGQLEAEGKAMRYLRRNGKTVAWKATLKCATRLQPQKLLCRNCD